MKAAFVLMEETAFIYCLQCWQRMQYIRLACVCFAAAVGASIRVAAQERICLLHCLLTFSSSIQLPTTHTTTNNSKGLLSLPKAATSSDEAKWLREETERQLNEDKGDRGWRRQETER